MFLLRIIYFILVGWWLGTLWSILAYLLCLSVLGLPLGLMMFNKLPQVLTLKPVNNSYDQNSQNVVVKKELPFILRAVYFILIGWELTGVMVTIALLLCISIIGLPLGLWILNRIPFILTLKLNY